MPVMGRRLLREACPYLSRLIMHLPESGLMWLQGTRGSQDTGSGFHILMASLPEGSPSCSSAAAASPGLR